MMTMLRNAIFDPELYVAQGGEIIDFDPAYAAREKARRRSIANRRLREKSLKEEEIRRKKVVKSYYRMQRITGFLLMALAIMVPFLINMEGDDWGGILIIFLTGAGSAVTNKMIFYI